MSTKYRKKNNEVVALQLNTDTVGKILELIQKPIQYIINFNVSIRQGVIELSFRQRMNASSVDIEVIADQGDYFVFAESDYELMTEGQFKQMFEPVTTSQPFKDYPKPNTTGPIIPPYVWPQPYQPRTWQDQVIPWDQIIVKD